MNKMKEIIVVPKLSMVQVDMHKYCLTEKELRERYEGESKDVDNIFESHESQMLSVGLLKKKFPESIFYRESFNRKIADSAKIIIAAGGDDHLKYLSPYITDTPVLGLNTDPRRTRGELLEDSVEDALENLEKGNFDIVEKTRILAEVNKIPFLLGMSIYSVGRNDPDGNFRYRIEFKDKYEEHPITSGILVYSGIGLTDWVQGAGKYLGDKLEKFDQLERKIGWVVKEPHDDYNLLNGLIRENEELHIISYKDDSKISADAIKEHKKLIQSGDNIVFKISDKPLRVVKINK